MSIHKTLMVVNVGVVMLVNLYGMPIKNDKRNQSGFLAPESHESDNEDIENHNNSPMELSRINNFFDEHVADNLPQGPDLESKEDRKDISSTFSPRQTNLDHVEESELPWLGPIHVGESSSNRFDPTPTLQRESLRAESDSLRSSLPFSQTHDEVKEELTRRKGKAILETEAFERASSSPRQSSLDHVEKSELPLLGPIHVGESSLNGFDPIPTLQRESLRPESDSSCSSLPSRQTHDEVKEEENISQELLRRKGKGILETEACERASSSRGQSVSVDMIKDYDSESDEIGQSEQIFGLQQDGDRRPPRTMNSLSDIDRWKSGGTVSRTREAREKVMPGKIVQDERMKETLEQDDSVVSKESLRKMKGSPTIQIKEDNLEIATTEVPRCQRCKLLGHRAHHCWDYYRAYPSSDESCLDCRYTPLVNGGRSWNKFHVDPRSHKTDDPHCITKAYVSMKWRQYQKSLNKKEPFDSTQRAQSSKKDIETDSSDSDSSNDDI